MKHYLEQAEAVLRDVDSRDSGLTAAEAGSAPGRERRTTVCCGTPPRRRSAWPKTAETSWRRPRRTPSSSGSSSRWPIP